MIANILKQIVIHNLEKIQKLRFHLCLLFLQVCRDLIRVKCKIIERKEERSYRVCRDLIRVKCKIIEMKVEIKGERKKGTV
jgi:hypothetical protein